MIGAIIGDVVGSVYEFDNIRTTEFDLIDKRAYFTDDTVCTIAFMDFFLHAPKYDEETAVKYLHKWTNKYPNAGYGGRFWNWVHSSNPQPYNSYGNGSAMRISSVGYVAKSLKEVEELVEIVTKITHGHPEGIKGAMVVAKCIYLSRVEDVDKSDLWEYVRSEYPVLSTFDYEDLVKYNRFDETCQGSVPQALYCFLYSENFEDCLRTTISIGGDSDTLAAISCAVAEAYYQEGIPEELIEHVYNKLTPEMRVIVDEFKEKYPY